MSLHTDYTDSNGSSTIRFTSCSVAFRPTVVGTRVHLHFKVTMGAQSLLHGGTGSAWERQMAVWVGTSGWDSGMGHLMEMSRNNGTSWHTVSSGDSNWLLKRANNSNDFWNKGESYLYKLRFDIPYVNTSSATVRTRVLAGDGVARSPGHWGSSLTGQITWSNPVSRPSAPPVPSSVSLRGSTVSNSIIVGEEGSYIMNTVWEPPTVAPIPILKQYEVRRRRSDESYSYFERALDNRTHTRTLDMQDGQLYEVGVRSENIYGLKSSYVTRTRTLSVPPPPEPDTVQARLFVNNTHRPAIIRKIRVNNAWQNVKDVWVRANNAWQKIKKG